MTTDEEEILALRAILAYIRQQKAETRNVTDRIQKVLDKVVR